MKTLIAFKSLALTLALATLAGCGNTGLLAAATSTGATGDLALKSGFGGQRGGKAGPGGGHEVSTARAERGDKGFGVMQLAGVTLTAEQQTQVQAIAEKYKPTAPTDGEKPEAPGAGIQALLTAGTVNVEALKAALAAQPTAPAPKDDHRLAQLVEIRAVLTEAQRAQIVEKLQAAPAQPTDRPSPPADAQRPEKAELTAELVAKLGLNAEQQAAFEAFQAKLEANRPAKDDAAHQAQHEARRAAEITFWQTGDTAALKAAKPAQIERPSFPVDELVALATSLSVEQRQQLFAGRGGYGIGMGFGGHGHKGGPGGKGGHKGGRGGERPQAPATEAAAE